LRYVATCVLNDDGSWPSPGSLPLERLYLFRSAMNHVRRRSAAALWRAAGRHEHDDGGVVGQWLVDGCADGILDGP
jgi:hypothetical protein